MLPDHVEPPNLLPWLNIWAIPEKIISWFNLYVSAVWYKASKPSSQYLTCSSFSRFLSCWCCLWVVLRSYKLPLCCTCVRFDKLNVVCHKHFKPLLMKCNTTLKHLFYFSITAFNLQFFWQVLWHFDWL